MNTADSVPTKRRQGMWTKSLWTRMCGLVAMGMMLILTPMAEAEKGNAEETLGDATGTNHMVFAHYMTCFTESKEFCKHEIQIAQAHGIDGFAMDFGVWLDRAAPYKPSGYVKAMDNMFAAAKELGTGFKLLLTPEYSVGPVEIQIPDMVERYYNHPNAMRYNGKFCLSTYGVAGDIFRIVLSDLKEKGYDIFFIPYASFGRHEMAASMESALAILRKPYVDGAWRFVADGSLFDLMISNANYRRAALLENKIYMAGIAPNYNSANVRDMQGLHGYEALWRGIISDEPDWVEIVTWNDYNEDTNLMHYKWKRDWDKQLYNRDGTYLDATAYYVSWYKSGQKPAVTQDKIYFAYRDRSKWLTKAWDEKKGEWKIITLGKWPFTQIHDDVRDYVYFTTFLTEPAQLSVTLGGKEELFDMPAGIGHGEVPMAPGVPHFVLKRKNATLLDVIGRRSIVAEETKENSPYIGSHLQSRIWAGGAAAGKVVRLEAEKGVLQAGAEIRSDAVFVPTSQGASITLPVGGLKTAIYNIRFRYSNPHAYDRRLTLFANGVSYDDEANGARYRIPLWLPPTGEGEWADATLLWTLFDETTEITIECNRNEPPADEKARKQWKISYFDRSGWQDTADILIDAVDLVRVTPMTFPQPQQRTRPELVKIPGGSFTMGLDRSSEKDEVPGHKVTVSTFYMGKYEVTNEEFERLMPEHRKWRDGFSWRNREPVIYVKWTEAATYCNRLSREAGLTPVYDEKTWTADMKADGYRLPTEAEWEFVATGRGEDRIYPWGDEAPEPMVHGNFMGSTVLNVPEFFRSTEPAGVVEVGSFPLGVSRDGVLDLAGNVSEWCTDWYQLYDGTAAINPVETADSHSRVIRGGSWGYYGLSQRSKDREFNSQSYPGYIYIGFRVVLPEAGWRAL